MTDPEDGPSEQELREQTSMTNWWPRVRDLDVPTPETVEVGTMEMEIDDGAPATDETTIVEIADYGEVAAAIDEVDGPPAFIRSGQMSEKHRMAKASKLSSTDADEFGSNVWQLFEAHMMAGGVPNPECYYVREWLDLRHEFTAFTGTPIASELRFFVNNGSVHEVGFYWPEDAIRRPDSENWEQELAALRENALGQRDEVADLAATVAGEFDGYWSVDFAETEDGDWYLIDMARGEVSFHPDDCEMPEAIA